MRTARKSFWVFATLLLALMAAPMPAQRIWRVNRLGGPGVDYLDLPPAVAAAAPGDIIWVYFDDRTTGVSIADYYAAPTIDKPLIITGFHTWTRSGHPRPTVAPMNGMLSVANIPAGSQVVLSNLGLGSFPPAGSYPNPPVPFGVEVTNCAGQIVMEGVNFPSDGYVNARFSFSNCADVIMRGCYVGIGGVPIDVNNSNLLMSSCDAVSELPSILWPSAGYQTNRETIRVAGTSRVTLVDTFVEGAWELSRTPNWYSQPAVVVAGGTLMIGPGSFLIGGRFQSGTDPSTGQPLFSRDNAYEYWGPQPQGQVLRDERGTYSVHPWPQFRSPLATLTTLHATYSGFVVQGEPYDVGVFGDAFGWGLLYAGYALQTPFVTPFGLLGLDPAALVPLAIVPLDQYGHGTVRLQCSPLVPVSTVFGFQAGAISRTGVWSLMLPSTFTVGWEHGRNP